MDETVLPNRREEHKMSFMASVLATIPFTKRNRAATELLKTLDDYEIYKEELKRISTIKKDIKNGDHERALKELLGDTSSEIRYFSQLRHASLGFQSTQITPKSGLGNIREISENDQKMISTKKMCQWKGFDSKGRAIHCLNIGIIHPWKTVKNVHGNLESKQLDFCSFHSKYCIDKEKRHGINLAKIVSPNEEALCNECFALLYNRSPLKNICIQRGIRRTYCEESQKEANNTIDYNIDSDRNESYGSSSEYDSHHEEIQNFEKLIETRNKSKLGTTKIMTRKVRSNIRFFKAYLHGRHKFVIKLQSIWRMYVSKRRLQIKLKHEACLAINKRCLIIQRFYKRCLNRRIFRENMAILKYAVNIIIKYTRMFIAKLIYKKNRSAKKIQEWFRRLHNQQYSSFVKSAYAQLIGIILSNIHSRIQKCVLYGRWKKYYEKTRLSCKREILKKIQKNKDSRQGYSLKSCKKLSCGPAFKSLDRVGSVSIITLIQPFQGNSVDSLRPLELLSNKCHNKSHRRHGNGKLKGKIRTLNLHDKNDMEETMEHNHQVDYLNRYMRERLEDFQNRLCESNDVAYGRWFSTSKLEEIRSIVSSVTPFRKLDPFEIGILRRHDFVRVLVEKWKEIGCTLHFEEQKLITRTFEPNQDGYVNYNKFVKFAKEQEKPCEIHSRIVCTKCKVRGNSDLPVKAVKSSYCKRFIPISRSRPNLCLTCGAYIASHVLLPKPNHEQKYEAGKIPCSEVLQRILRKECSPDISFNLPNRKIENNHNEPALNIRTKSASKTNKPMKMMRDSGTVDGILKKFNAERTIKEHKVAILSRKGDERTLVNMNYCTGENNDSAAPTMLLPDNLQTVHSGYEENLIDNKFPQILQHIIGESLEPCNNKNKYIICPIKGCNKKFPSDTKIKKHLKNQHNPSDIMSCLPITQKSIMKNSSFQS